MKKSELKKIIREVLKTIREDEEDPCFDITCQCTNGSCPGRACGEPPEHIYCGCCNECALPNPTKDIPK